MARIVAVFFDLYETLVTEFDPDWRPRPTPADRLGISAKAFDSEWRARRHVRMTGSYVDYRDVLRAICVDLDLNVDDKVLEQLWAERLAYKAAPFMRIEEDVMCMLHGIQLAGVKVGLISNCAPEEVTAWETSSLPAFFDDAVFSHQTGFAKPEPRIYSLACVRLDVAPERSIFIGDGGSDELAGAARAGLIPFQTTWFLDRWPSWRRSAPFNQAAGDYPVLHAPAEVVNIVAAPSPTSLEVARRTTCPTHTAD